MTVMEALGFHCIPTPRWWRWSLRWFLFLNPIGPSSGCSGVFVCLLMSTLLLFTAQIYTRDKHESLGLKPLITAASHLGLPVPGPTGILQLTEPSSILSNGPVHPLPQHRYQSFYLVIIHFIIKRKTHPTVPTLAAAHGTHEPIHVLSESLGEDGVEERVGIGIDGRKVPGAMERNNEDS